MPYKATNFPLKKLLCLELTFTFSRTILYGVLRYLFHTVFEIIIIFCNDIVDNFIMMQTARAILDHQKWTSGQGTCGFDLHETTDYLEVQWGMKFYQM